MNDYEKFKNSVDEFLSEDRKYENQINNFNNYLKEWSLEEKIFYLTKNNINQYFIYSIDSIDSTVGFESTLISHISALKSLFDYLCKKQLNFYDLLGYITTTGFVEKQKEKVEKTFSKPILDYELIRLILNKLDIFLSNQEKKELSSLAQRRKYFDMMISRIYIKLSLILPLKTSQMLDIQIKGILTDDVRIIEYNEIFMKLPNSLREQIITTIKYAQDNFSQMYKENDRLFDYLYSAIGKKAKTYTIETSLPRTYKKLGIKEMLKKINVGKRNKFVYPPECYKITAIFNMLENGTNIVYLKKLTGLDISTLISDYDFEKNNISEKIISTSINHAIISLDYFTYI
jgi:hypothetical protein